MRRHSKPPSTSSGTREARHDSQQKDPLLTAEFQALARPSTNYRSQRPRPLRLKTKSAAKKLGTSSSRHSEIQF